MSSCDYFGDYFYYIENGLPSDTVTVITHITRYHNTNESRDSVFVLLPQDKKLIRRTSSGAMLRHDHPRDVLVNYCQLGNFEVFINDRKLEKNLWERKYWEYTTRELEGTYLLVIDEKIINGED
jgi:hypothetical protein